MRIALVPGAFLPQIGGMEVGAYNLARNLKSLGHEVYLITSQIPINFPSFEFVDKIPVHRLPFYTYRDSAKSLAATIAFMPWACFRYALLLRRYKVEIVNVRYFYHNAIATYHISGLLRRWRIPVVVTLEGPDPPNIPDWYRETHRSETRILDHVSKRFLSRVAAVTSVSEAHKNKTVKKRPDLAKNHFVIHNGVDVERFVATKFSMNRNIVSVGRLAPEKGFDTLISAFAKVSKILPDWTLTIIGDGPLREDLLLLSRNLFLDNKVIFKGQLNPAEVAKELARSAFFALASRYEAFALAGLEAMACGRPVLLSAVEGANELVVNSRLGRIFPIDDIEALIHEMIEMINLGDKLETMGLACAEYVRYKFSWKKIAKCYEDLFKWAISSMS